MFPSQDHAASILRMKRLDLRIGSNRSSTTENTVARMKRFGRTQRTQVPLIKEYAFNYRVLNKP